MPRTFRKQKCLEVCACAAFPTECGLAKSTGPGTAILTEGGLALPAPLALALRSLLTLAWPNPWALAWLFLSTWTPIRDYSPHHGHFLPFQLQISAIRRPAILLFMNPHSHKSHSVPTRTEFPADSGLAWFLGSGSV